MKIAPKDSFDAAINEWPNVRSGHAGSLHLQIRCGTGQCRIPVDEQLRLAVRNSNVSESRGFRNSVEPRSAGRLLDFPLTKYVIRESEFAIKDRIGNPAGDLPFEASFAIRAAVNEGDILQVR